MKKILLLFVLVTFFTHLNAQQEEYGEFLQNAITAVKDGRIKEFNTNFRYFVAAMNQQEITPESLTKENYDLFSECILWGVTSKFITAEDLKTDLTRFLEFDTENHPANLYTLGALYFSGIGVKQDYEKAKNWYEKGVEKDEMWSCVGLGVMYLTGLGVEKDVKKAMSYYQKSADLGNTSALSGLASIYQNGKLFGVKTDTSKAIGLYKQAIEKANDFEKGMYMSALATLYESMNNKKEAENWYSKAKEHNEIQAGKGNVFAMQGLGAMYQNGNGVEKDTGKAIEWYEKSADLGNTSAMVIIGVIYQYGNGVEKDKDMEKAIHWYEKAAEKNDFSAMSLLGTLYQYGNGVEKNIEKAKEWYKKSCEAGFETACQSYETLK